MPRAESNTPNFTRPAPYSLADRISECELNIRQIMPRIDPQALNRLLARLQRVEDDTRYIQRVVGIETREPNPSRRGEDPGVSTTEFMAHVSPIHTS
jgi:hypothetical protein